MTSSIAITAGAHSSHASLRSALVRSETFGLSFGALATGRRGGRGVTAHSSPSRLIACSSSSRSSSYVGPGSFGSMSVVGWSASWIASEMS